MISIENLQTATIVEPITRNVTIPSGSFKLFFLSLGSQDARDYYFTSATLDGQALTRVATASADYDTDAGVDLMYIDVSTWSAGTYSLSYNVSTGSPDFGGVADFTMVINRRKPITLLLDTDSNSQSGGGTLTNTLTATNKKQICIDAFFTVRDGDLTAGAGQTQIFQFNPQGAGNRFGASYKITDSAGNTTMTWTGNSGENVQVSGLFDTKQKAGGGFLYNLI